MRYWVAALVFWFSVITILFSQNVKNGTVRPGRDEPVSGRKLPVDFSPRWKSIDTLESLGKTKSELEAARKLYADAAKAGNIPSQIKAAMYILRLSEKIEENSVPDNYKWLRSEIAKSKSPARQMLESVTANWLLRYYESRRWEIMAVTVTGEDAGNDILAWDARQFEKEIRKHFLASIEPAEPLKLIMIRDYEEILVDGSKKGDILRPTLYDFLAHQVVDFLSSDVSRSTLVGLSSAIDEGRLLEPASKFIKDPLFKKDSSDTRMEAMKIYRDLIDFHDYDKRPDAFVQVDLERLNLAHAIMPANRRTDSLYYSALVRLEQQFPGDSVSAEIGFTRANFINNNRFTPPGSDPSKSIGALALEICENYISKYQGSLGAGHCAVLKAQITEKVFEVRMGSFQVPGRQSKFKISSKNIDRIYYKVVKSTGQEVSSLMDNPADSAAKYFLPRTAIAGGFILTNSSGYTTHEASGHLNFETGFYIVAFSYDKEFSLTGNKVLFLPVISSRMRLVTATFSLGADNYGYVLDAMNGRPVKSATVTLTKNDYYSEPKKPVLPVEFKTGKDGRFPMPKESGSYSFKAIKGSDTFPLSSFYSDRTLNTEKTENKQTFIFTDRGAYRPGQTVYFKSITVIDKSGKNQVAAGENLTVNLNDANGQQVQSLNLTTNDFGSASGSFNLPSSVLPGVFTIQTENGLAEFQVEEYKRPQFEIVLDKVKGSYRLGQQINVTGHVATFSGMPLGGVPLKYVVTRNLVYRGIMFGFGPYERMTPGRFSKAQISQGTVSTSADGRLSIAFRAIPDESVEVDSNISYVYTVSVDAQDLSGSTQSAESDIIVGYRTLNISMSMPDWYNGEHPPFLSILSSNLNGEKVNAKGTFTIYRLKEPGYPEHPEENSYVYSGVKYVGFKMPVEKAVYSTGLNTNAEGHSMPVLRPGRYKAVFLAKDTFGAVVSDTAYFKTYDPSSRKAPIKSFSFFIPDKVTASPGENATVIWGSSVKCEAHYVVERNGEILNSGVLDVNNGQKKIEIPVTEKKRGGFFIHLFTVVDNHFYSYDQKIDVPWVDDQLKITTETFRDKLKPGDHETWRFTIKGPNGESAAAEMVASLYDASLDEIRPAAWNFGFYNYVVPTVYFSDAGSFADAVDVTYENSFNDYPPFEYISFRSMKYLDMMFSDNRMYMKSGIVAYDTDRTTSGNIAFTPPSVDNKSLPKPVDQPRKNLQELAFFYPQLRTNDKGEIVIEFTVPDALTRWNFLALAHTKDLAYGLLRKTAVTQKELMVQPNVPRFVREGDSLLFTARVSNLSAGKSDITTEVSFTDVMTGKTIPFEYRLYKTSMETGGNEAVSWKMKIPLDVEGIVYHISSTNGTFTDAEEGIIPVLPSRILLNDAMRMQVNANETKTFSLKSLLNYKAAGGKPLRLTLEAVSNPAWYAVQALPYLAETPYESADQVFTRFYANSIAAHILKTNKEIKTVFDAWKSDPADPLSSKLEQNPGLKSLLLAETPWVAQAKDESARKHSIALYFDENNLEKGLNDALTKLSSLQLTDGSWPWFEGMPSNREVTTAIVAGIGRLERLGIRADEDKMMYPHVLAAVKWMDTKLASDYDRIASSKQGLEGNHLTPEIVQYMYARSFFNEVPIEMGTGKAFSYFMMQSSKYWTSLNLADKAMLAIAMSTMNENRLADKIMTSIDQEAIRSTDNGMYWKQNTGGYGWYNQPVETQSLVIEAYNQVWQYPSAVIESKKWLILQKEVQDWGNTKATADACYAILVTGDRLLGNNKLLKIYLGDVLVDTKNRDERVPGGTGYYSHTWSGSEILPSMGKIKVVNENDGTAFAAIYYQSWLEADTVKKMESGIGITKSVFVRETTQDGTVLKPLGPGAPLHIGDAVTVRLTIKNDRDMSYVHLKDMRATALEPVEYLSGMHYSGRLSYYQAIRDASVSFFFENLQKGTHIIEYTLRATQKGVFSNGTANVESFYAPQFSSHTAGGKVTVR